MTVMIKPELRRILRNRREDDEIRQRQSAMICSHILNDEIYCKANVIAGYVPMNHEADITHVLKHALQAGKILVLPRCHKKPKMTLHRITDLDELKPGKYGIPEPADDATKIPMDAVDLILIPLEGIDGKGYRLGKGAGYYDCLLAGSSVTTMGCALKWQVVEETPRDTWDVPLKMCATPDGILTY